MNLIAVVDRNWAIGRGGKLLAHISADLRYFRRMTAGKVVVMGRKTLESFPKMQPLPDRINIVLTQDKTYTCEGALIVHSVEEALEKVRAYPAEDVFIIGGGQIYRSFLPHCDAAYITKVDYEYDADTYFPNLDQDPDWKLVEIGEEQTQLDLIFQFIKYKRIAEQTKKEQ